MKRSKKIATLILAFTVCVSFLLHNTGASSYFEEFDDPSTEVLFFTDGSNRSFAHVYMTEAGGNEDGYCDLTAHTYAENIFYHAYNPSDPYQYYIVAEVGLGVTYEDESHDTYNDFEMCTDNWTCGGVSALIEYPSPTPEGYYIQTFTASHNMYTVYGLNGYPELREPYGRTIIIGTSS